MRNFNGIGKIAVSRATGELRTVEEVGRGIKCDCNCPACGYSVLSRQGPNRSWHFSHIGEYMCSSESILHSISKKIVSDALNMVIPGYFANGNGLLVERRIFFKSAEVEPIMDGFRPDVALRHKTGRELLVEIMVTHAVDEEKRAKIRRYGSRCVEIDLRDHIGILQEEDGLQIITRTLIDENDHKHWIYHPVISEHDHGINAKNGTNVTREPSIELVRLQVIEEFAAGRWITLPQFDRTGNNIGNGRIEFDSVVTDSRCLSSEVRGLVHAKCSVKNFVLYISFISGREQPGEVLFPGGRFSHVIIDIDGSDPSTTLDEAGADPPWRI